MIIGVPKETQRQEHRVGLSPFAVSRLARKGHSVLLEAGAGDAANFLRQSFEEAGGKVVYSADEVYKRADLICRVGLVPPGELDHVKPGSVLCAFQHLAVAPKTTVERLMQLEATVVGYELIRDAHGDLPVLVPSSEMGGRMAVHLAAYYLQNQAGGRGILLGSLPGVPPPTVAILGAGTVGRSAARQALASGAHVIVLDADLRKLRALDREFQGQLATAVASQQRLMRFTAIADVLIGAILIPGARAPFVVTEQMVEAMKPGSVIIDVSIDQGGCIETSRPTSLEHPTFTVHGVVHYCVPNMTSNVARTATRALANAALPYVCDIADHGLEDALRADEGLAEGVLMYRGQLVNDKIAETLGVAAAPLGELLEKGARR